MNENPSTVSAKRAISVFRFLSSIPESIQRHVFNQILEDAFAKNVIAIDVLKKEKKLIVQKIVIYLIII